MIKTEKISDIQFEVLFGDNNLPIGIFEMDVDGYFYYITSSRRGSWNSNAMRMIADKLDEINKPWDDQIKNDPIFNKKRPRKLNRG